MQKQQLSDAQKSVLFDKATEKPFSGELLYNHDSGCYHCANCQAKLFDSTAKYDSDCGWPSFDRAIENAVSYVADSSYGMDRTEVTCSSCGGHLGHLFADGPSQTTGQRYCINSLAMAFEATNK